MKQIVPFAVAGVALFGTGCLHFPVQLGAFYHEHELFRGLAAPIETKQTLESDNAKNIEGRLSHEEGEHQRRAEEMKQAKACQHWLASLTSEDCFQWIHGHQQNGIQRR